MALSQNAARQPNYYGQESIGKVKRSQPNVVDVVNTTLGILKDLQKLVRQRKACGTNKLVQITS